MLWRRGLERRISELMPSQALFESRLADFTCLARLPEQDRPRLRRLAAEILATKQFLGAGGLQPDYRDCLTVALHAALPVLDIGLDNYRNFQTFILYAQPFEADIEETDEAGVVHRGRDLRAGEAWHRGPVVLSLSDVADSGHGEGFHVVIHELAHQIDQLNGEANGFPLLTADISHEDWVRSFSAAYQQLLDEIESGQPPCIDDYGAESPAEFFAVACEFFFDCPDYLDDTLPEIYSLLSRLFKQDPAAHYQ
ncbi:MAG: zinc-dependent peptidase [Xanthomonadaceae bacterium]|nr:zinc-dependent peptidase [Xanthomonadaceae bacterium]